MKPILLGALTLLPLVSWAQAGAYVLDIPPSPIRAQSLLNGQMIVTDTEFLTPEGIIDDLPQQAAVQPEPAYDALEPAAGPDTSPPDDQSAYLPATEPAYGPTAGLTAQPESDLMAEPTLSRDAGSQQIQPEMLDPQTDTEADGTDLPGSN